MSFCVASSSKRRPIKRFVAKTVFSGFVTACRFAGTPTRRWPSVVVATMEGVVRMPSEFSRTFGELPSMTATQEFVVPRSMPMMLPALLRSAADALRKPRLLLRGAAAAAAPEGARERMALDIDMLLL